MSDNIQEKLQKQMIKDVKVASSSRKFVLIALVIAAIAIYAIWRIKNPDGGNISVPTSSENVALPTLADPDESDISADSSASLPNLSDPLPLSLEAVLGDAPSTSASSTTSDNTAVAASNFVADDSGIANQNVTAETPINSTTSNNTRSAADYLGNDDSTADYFSNSDNTARANSSSANYPTSSSTASSTSTPRSGASQSNGFSSTSSQTERIHIIKDGESLPELAARYYGAATAENIRRIRNANPNLRHGGFRDGTPLRIPFAENELETSTTVGEVIGSGQYTVESGDTLSAIAAKNLGAAKRWREIFELNRDQLSAPENLRVGMRIKLPPQ